MKALIISDSHRDQAILEQLTTKFAGQVDIMIHCGDSELPSDQVKNMGLISVRGNNDDDKNYPFEEVIEKDKVKFLVVHGHLDQVVSSLTPLMLKAQSIGANIVCYGHTHQLAVTVEKGILFINPGSITLPRGEYTSLGGTMAIVEVGSTEFIVDYYKRNGDSIPELHFEFSRK